MRKHWPTLVAMSVLVLAPLGLHAPLLAQTAAALPAQARVIVKFKAESTLLRKQAQSATRISSSNERAASLGERVGRVLVGGAMVSERMQVVSASGVSSAELARSLAAQSDVEYAVPDQRRRHYAPPNDPRYAAGLGGSGPAVGQWYLRAPTATVRSAIDAEAAWDTSTGSASVVVAVLDTGIRADHVDLAGNLLPGYDMVSADGTNDFRTANDGSGRDADPADPGDWLSASDLNDSFFADCADVPEDSSWHGTQTAGLIGALTDNSLGMASVGRTVRVLPVRVLGKCGGYDSDIIAGMRWAAGLPVSGVPANTTPAKVINLSLGGEGNCSQVYVDAVNEITAAGSVVVVSAGNSAGHAVSSPANCPGVIAVTGLRHIGSKVGFADVGPQVAISAPGGNCVNVTGDCLYPILTTTNAGTTNPTPNSSTYTDSNNISVGTSFSAPLVAGTVGLMFSAQPGMTPADVRAALQGSARSFPNSGAAADVAACQAPTGADQLECYCTTSTCGAGMLDAGVAVAGAARGLQARITLNSESPSAPDVITLSAGNSFVLSPRTLDTYQWVLVDGGGIVTTLTANGASATATPSGAGRFIARLTVTDSSGAQSTTDRAVDVLAAPVTPPTLARSDDSGGGSLGPVWLLGLALGVMALMAERNRRVRKESIPVGRNRPRRS